MQEQYHFIGIGGIGMSGLARIMLSRNIPVSGSDIAGNSVTEALSQAGAKVHIGHSAHHIASHMTVVYSTDIKTENPEYQAALKHKCQILHRSELLQKLMENQVSIAVAGTHGKTTTSSLLTWVLVHSGYAPSYAIGGVVPQLKSNAAHGNGQHFVAEACESDGTFLNYTPYGAIVTNIDFDHMDHYGTQAALVKAFKDFMSKVRSTKHLFWCHDDPLLKDLRMSGNSYGFTKGSTLRAHNFKQNEWMCTFDVDFNGKTYSQIRVSLAGKHNALNALAVFGMALSLGIDEEKIRAALSSFDGVSRRCEKKGEVQGILLLDDYAHHPTEICATLKAIRQAIGERRLVVAYQPHRFSRAKECMGLYQGVFNEADKLFLTEIYAAREAPIDGISHEKIIAEIQKDLKDRCQYSPREQLASTLCAFLRPHDVLVTLGAGDITKAASEVLAQFKLKPPKKLKVGAIMGGQSVEHEVSLLSAENIIACLRSDFYDIETFGITRQGNWIAGPETRNMLQRSEGLDVNNKISSDVLERVMNCDIFFPILHGPLGEDGTIQGLFDIIGKAYVGCDHRSAAISMDKTLTKLLLLNAGIPTSPFISFSRHEYENDSEHFIKRIHSELHFPLFVKPTHLGSSIGVHKAVDNTGLLAAIKDAFRFDTHILVENGIQGREMEFSVLGNDNIAVFPPGEICTEGRIYDYEGKYSPNGTKTIVQADLPQDIIQEGIMLVKQAYIAVGCRGMARIDTFLDTKGKFWVNEINPIPGFTKNSLYPQMCAANGIKPTDLIDRLIILGLEQKRRRDMLEIKPTP